MSSSEHKRMGACTPACTPFSAPPWPDGSSTAGGGRDSTTTVGAALISHLTNRAVVRFSFGLFEVERLDIH